MSTEDADEGAGIILASVESLPDWVRPPAGGFTADHFLRIRGLPRQTELIDGALVFAAPQTLWHSCVKHLIGEDLRRQAPDGLIPVSGMTVKLDDRQAPAPDVALVTLEACRRGGPDLYFFSRGDVRLVVEVVLPDSEIRDRDVKPRRYAAAGIPHFWRVEDVGDRTVVFVHELDHAARSYGPPSVHRGRLKVTVPFDIEIDLAAIDARW
ncbi:Uma2 family endonuclease [Actinomadura montaniterrae]|uniref:Uma2 family endonuclease n=1 Tax=Actinomadura montaniterrae TaxID=1803903 RepID=UPI001CEF5945|nr:Uma2 family endonuclease [Actinomadura montaniterrae]